MATYSDKNSKLILSKAIKSNVDSLISLASTFTVSPPLPIGNAHFGLDETVKSDVNTIDELLANQYNSFTISSNPNHSSTQSVSSVIETKIADNILLSEDDLMKEDLIESKTNIKTLPQLFIDYIQVNHIYIQQCGLQNIPLNTSIEEYGHKMSFNKNLDLIYLNHARVKDFKYLLQHYETVTIIPYGTEDQMIAINIAYIPINN